MPAKIAKWGNSAGVRIPAATLDAAGLSIGDEVDVVARDGMVELRPRRLVRTVEEIFAEHLKKHGRLEPPPWVDWGPPVGAEILPEEDWSDIAPTDEEMGIPRATSKRARSRRR